MPIHPFATPIGVCRLAWEDDLITAFRLPDDHLVESPASAWAAAPENVIKLAARVYRHLAGTAEDFADVPYDYSRVSAFQRAVYQAALKVKAGQTLTYGELARATVSAGANARAVGTALGQNPWPLLVPCHRFIAADGKMTGFSGPGGINTKLRLLALEGAEWFAV